MVEAQKIKDYTFKYDKLVRDKMPEIISKEGWSLKQKKLSEPSFKKALRVKLVEEVEEFLEAKDRRHTLVELADVQEIIEALVRSYGFTKQELSSAQREKKKRTGGYKNKTYIDSISYLPGADETWLKYHLKNRKKFPLIK